MPYLSRGQMRQAPVHRRVDPAEGRLQNLKNITVRNQQDVCRLIPFFELGNESGHPLLDGIHRFDIAAGAITGLIGLPDLRIVRVRHPFPAAKVALPERFGQPNLRCPDNLADQLSRLASPRKF
jgi:hypothetical protein